MIGAPAPAREHPEPGEEPAARLALDHEQRVDRTRAEHEPVVALDLDREVVDIDHDLEPGPARRCDDHPDPQRILSRLDPAIRRTQAQLAGDQLGGDLWRGGADAAFYRVLRPRERPRSAGLVRSGMTVEAELIDAIVAAPDDDAPRLIYADWLMQRGDPRGELMALQCRLAGADTRDEPVDEAVIARERELREAHGDAWTAPLRAIVDGGYQLRRGFVEHAVVWNPVCQLLPILLAPGPRFVTSDDLSRLFEAAPLLRSVALRGAVIETNPEPDASWARLRALELTESVRVSGSDPIATFIQSPHLASLRRLQLTTTSGDDAQVRAWLGLAQPLEHLGFHCGWHVSAAPNGVVVGERIATNRALHGLRSLHLGNLALLDLTPLACLQQLERLALHRCAVTAGDVVQLARRLPRLEMLELDNADGRLGDLALGELLAAVPNLRRLSLRDWAIGSTGARAIASAPTATVLRRLELDNCAIDDDAVDALLAADGLRGVVWWRIHEHAHPAMSARFEARHRLHDPEPPPVCPPSIHDYLPRQKIMAIKTHREITGAGLADSKMAVERIAEELGIGFTADDHRATTRWCRA